MVRRMSESWVLVLVGLLAAGTVASAAPPSSTVSSIASVGAETFTAKQFAAWLVRIAGNEDAGQWEANG